MDNQVGLAVSAAPKKKQSAFPPQKALDEHWDRFVTKTPGKITRIFPPNLSANLLPQTVQTPQTENVSATASYEDAKKECERKVKRIIRECRRTNEKWSDPDFDIESDFYQWNCLCGLVDDDDGDDDDDAPPSHGVNAGELQSALTTLASVPDLFNPTPQISVLSLVGVLQNSRAGADPSTPGAVHRVGWIYDEPAFTIKGFDVSDVQQGGSGDCWWVAAVATLCSMPGQMERVCVACDGESEECGVYGFVLHRDGAWCPVVVDDNLYLSWADYDRSSDSEYDPSGSKARRYKEQRQTGSEALAFAKCADKNETWLPLLEKAYAKAHGDYAAIDGGFAGEGVEDMTGGVTTSIDTNKVLSKERLWQELLNPNKDFIFGTGTPGSAGGDSDTRNGLAYQHAYSVLKAVEEEDEDGKTVRLVRIRNPWGKRNWAGEGEWNGPWSDGSKEWNAYWLNKLDHKFGDDGVFWMTFDDILNRFNQLDRTRLFGEGWRMIQQWTSINVSWITGYINTKFVVEIKQGGLFVFVLSKLDHRYFRGLEGQHDFELHFVLQDAGSEVGDHIARVRPSSTGQWQRSVSAEVELKPGKYEVFPKIIATKNGTRASVEEIVKEMADKKPQKLRQIGLSYDFAHVKAVPPPTVSKDTAGAKPKQEQEVVKTEPETKSDDTAKEESSSEAVKEEVEQEPEVPSTETVKEEPSTEAVIEETATEGVKDEQAAPASEESTKADTGNEKTSEAKADKPTDLNPTESATEPAKTPEKAAAALGPRLLVPKPEVEEAKPKPREEEAKEADDEERSPWNAVCVIGLRVYSKDSEMTIKLEAPASAEEGSALNVDGEATGGTM